MPRVSHIAVAVTITEDDGSQTVHHASGLPVIGSWVDESRLHASIVPRFQTQVRRSTGEVVSATHVEDVHVTLTAVLRDDGHTRLFAVDHEGQPTIMVTEG